MKKTKLYNTRKEKGFSQEYLSSQLNMDKTSYNRRENGKTPIRLYEWEKLAEILSVDIEDIYETDYIEGVAVYDNGVGAITITNLNNNLSIPKEFIECRTKYIEKIENENKILLAEIEKLKEKLGNSIIS